MYLITVSNFKIYIFKFTLSNFLKTSEVIHINFEHPYTYNIIIQVII